MIKAIIFDLDGVLVDATEIHYEALNKALGLFGHTITREEHETVYNGLPTKEKLKKLFVPDGLKPFIAEMKKKYTDELMNTRLRPDYQKLILLMELRGSYTLACCSNAIKTSVVNMLDRVHLLGFFEPRLLLGNDEGLAPKPDPAMYHYLIGILGFQPEEVVIVEDSPHGIAAAKASGARVIEVRGYQDVHTGLFIKEGLL